MKITLPDGSFKTLDVGSNGFDIASVIVPVLAISDFGVSVKGFKKYLIDQIPEDS